MTDDRQDGDVDLLLATAGPRLRELRKGRGTTLPELSRATGISVSTLSRMESGQRRVTLEMLVKLARFYRLPIDDLVGMPQHAGPRALPRPIERAGMAFIPLARRPGGLQAFKMIVPARRPVCTAEQRSHEGYAWIYVLSGRLRLALGEHDMTLAAGEVAEFDTHVPHAFTNTGSVPTEAISIFGPQGERLQVRARPAGVNYPVVTGPYSCA
ncbi:helix-turn-helix domain-containing protein [Parafrankia elaeagni]|uniref:helix-turn-helix domain-containing protein n=1 Tax=Parafrankia elaeagni TaxID=222534 RepID=UPI00035EDB94|nr:XRE family transcriptional regulator [Parafrankia elaeagni]